MMDSPKDKYIVRRTLTGKYEKVRGLGHKSWQLIYFVDICKQITNVYVSCGMSAGIVCMQNNRWLCDGWL